VAEPVRFEVKFVPGGTGPAVLDHPSAANVIQNFLPPQRRHGPMIGIVHLGGALPTPSALRNVMAIGEDVRAGRYGDFSLVVSSTDAATRDVIGDIAKAQDIAFFVSESSVNLAQAEPVGALTEKDKVTLDIVLQLGGTVTATELARNLGVEQTTAGNRLVSLNKKGYLQRVTRAHPIGDLFVDPRSIQLRSD
jgi:hypothetical protein